MERIKNNVNHENDVLVRSPIHVQSTWIKSVIAEVGKIDAAHVLIDSLIYNLNKYKAFAINGADEFGLLYCAKEYQDSLKVSYKRARAIPGELVNDGWLESVDQRFTYNKKFYKPTPKALDFIHRLHLAQNDHFGRIDDADKMAVVPNGQTTCANLPKSYKDKKQDQKNNTLNNQHQELASLGSTENFDCEGIVIFDFSEFGIGAVKCEVSLFDYFTVNQAKAINTIAHVNADKIDIVAFNNALARKDIKREAQDFKQFVDWCYLVAVDAKGASVAKGSISVSDGDLAEYVVISDAENAILKTSLTTMDIDNTDILNVIDKDNANNEVVDQGNCGVNSEIVADQFLNLGESKYKDFVKLCLKRGFPSETKVIESATRAIKDYGKLNFDQLFKGICYGDFYGLKLINSEATTDIDPDNKKDQAHKKAKNPLSKNPSLKLPTLTDLKMPIIEKEVLKKDWASLAQQELVKDTVTECQKVALVAIIDYVKRKGVAITSDQEVYEWLYHTVANYEYYFSRATNFKHLANILIKRLVNQSFTRPSGFDNWRKMIGGSCGVDSIKNDNKTNNNYLKNYSNEVDLRLDRIVAKVSINNSEKSVKKCHKNVDKYRCSGGFVV